MAMQQVTRNVPIVFVLAPDPVGSGIVDSLSHPGRNATGFTSNEFGLSVKWLELLKQVAPNISRVAVLRDPANSAGIGQFGAIQGAAPSLVDDGSRPRRFLVAEPQLRHAKTLVSQQVPSARFLSWQRLLAFVEMGRGDVQEWPAAPMTVR
jgi:ABC transporter substrate binding protein